MTTRVQFRYTVQDDHGGVIQNTRVFLYQPGTTTDFVGRAFESKEGGEPVPNGFPTDEAGVAEAWLEVPQEVDVVVTSNGGEAYFPAKPTQPFDFEDKVETGWELLPALADLPTSRAEEVRPSTTVGHVVGGDLSYASGRHAHPLHPGRVRPSVRAPFSLTDTTAETPVAVLVVPGNTVANGSEFRVCAKFFTTGPELKPQVLTFKLRWGDVVLGRPWTLKQSGAACLEEPGVVEGLVTVRTAGGLGSAVGDLWGFESFSRVDAVPVPSASLAAGPSIVDTSVDRELVLTATFSGQSDESVLRIDNAYIQQVV